MDTPIDDLAVWARDYAAGVDSAGRDKLTEIAMFLDQCVDHRDTVALTAMVRAAASDANAVLSARCDARRADVVPCTGDGAKIKCADCPKRAGMAVTTHILN